MLLSNYEAFSSFLLYIQLVSNVNGNLLDSQTIEEHQLSVHEHDLAFICLRWRKEEKFFGSQCLIVMQCLRAVC